MNKPVVTNESIGNSIIILINGVPHISFRQEDFRAINSWKMGRLTKRFCAELIMITEKNGSIIKWKIELEYDSAELSNEILNILKGYI